MAYTRKAEMLEEARIALSAARTDPDLGVALNEVGLTPEKLAEGWALYEAAASRPVSANSQYGNRLLATRQVQALRRQLWAEYNAAAQVAQVVFWDQPGDLIALDIAQPHKTGPKRTRGGAADPIEPETTPTDVPPSDRPRRRRRARSDAHLDGAIKVFCGGARSDAARAAALAEVGYSAARLDAIEALAAQWLAARTAQMTALGEELGQRAQQRAAFQALQQWWRRFNGLVSAGLYHRPDVLSKLGVKTRGRKRRVA